MKRTLLALTVALSFMAVLGAGVSAQETDAVRAAAGSIYVVSAQAGGVNYVEGEVTTTQLDGTTGILAVGDTVEVGEIVKAGRNGRAEILMNPGSFIRINHGAEFEFASTSLEDLTVKFRSGTGIFEVFASDDFKVTLLAGESRFYLIQSGVYRVDVDAKGNARLEVWNGKAQAGTPNAKKIKKGRSAVITGSSVAISKFDKTMDGFETWSKERAKSIAEANNRLASRTLGRSVLSSFQNNDWNCYDSVGLWVFSRAARAFSFLPFGSRWRSPYGFSLGTNTPICYYPEQYWRPERWPNMPPNGGGSGGGTGGGTTAVVPQANIDRATRNTTPPFQRMQNSGSVRTSPSRSNPYDTSTGNTTSGFPSDRGGSTTRSTPSQSAPSAPAPTRQSSPPLAGTVKNRDDN